MSRSRNWTWTYFPETGKMTVDQMKVKLEAETVYSVFGVEKCPNTGRSHLQGYSVLKNTKTMSAFKKLLDKTMHLEHSSGSAEDNRIYCSKGDQSKEEWEEQKSNGPNYGKNATVWSCGTMPKPGMRTDIHELRDACENAVSLCDIIKEDALVVPLAKYQRFAQMVHSSALKKRTRDFRELEVIVRWGETSRGKTRLPYEEGAYMWCPDSVEWWDGYDGDEILLIDDFYGQIKVARMLHLMRGYQCRLPIKGGFTYAMWQKVYITSNTHPNMWYNGWEKIPNEVKDAFFARITTITKVV